jgi:hypothetical protein
MKTDRGKRKTTLWAAAALAVCASVAAALAAYALWAVSVKSEGNEVTVGLFMRVTADASPTLALVDGTGRVQAFAATFTAGISDSDTNEYDLYLCGVAFSDAGGQTDWNAHIAAVWQYAVYPGALPDGYDDYGGLTWRKFSAASRRLRESVSGGDAATLLLRVKTGADPAYLLGALRFSGELRAHGALAGASVAASAISGVTYAPASQPASAVTFTASIADGDPAFYDFVLTRIRFTLDSVDITERLAEVWEYYDGSVWRDFTSSGISGGLTLPQWRDVQDGDEIALLLRVKTGADPAYLSGALEFAGELSEPSS